MDSALCQRILADANSKRASFSSAVRALSPGNLLFTADSANHPLVEAVRSARQQLVQQDALAQLKNIGLTSLGIGAGAAGLAGLSKSLSSPAPAASARSPLLPLPYPEEEAEEAPPDDGQRKTADVTSPVGLAWFGPAALGAGLLGLGAGWKGIDAVLRHRARKERSDQLDEARSNFREAILGLHRSNKTAAALEQVFEKLDAALAQRNTGIPKQASWANFADNAAGGLAGGYGAYAGLSGLLAGLFVYDKIKKRSRQAVLQKAMQRRDRRQFIQQPPEVFAVTEPTSRA